MCFAVDFGALRVASAALVLVLVLGCRYCWLLLVLMLMVVAAAGCSVDGDGGDGGDGSDGCCCWLLQQQHKLVMPSGAIATWRKA